MRVGFDRRLKLEFHGSKITSDSGLLAYRELDDALGLTEVVGDVFRDNRTGKNGWHGMSGLFRQSVFGCLSGYEDVNDAKRLGRNPALRWTYPEALVVGEGMAAIPLVYLRLNGLVFGGGAGQIHGRITLGLINLNHAPGEGVNNRSSDYVNRM